MTPPVYAILAETEAVARPWPKHGAAQTLAIEPPAPPQYSFP
jgi:hypothetical protein